MDNTKLDILEFIRKFRTSTKDDDAIVELFTQGYCFWFAFILVTRFKGGKIYYNDLDNHYVMMLDGYFYDIRGELNISEDEKRYYIDWEEYKAKDKYHTMVLYRDCILKLPYAPIDYNTGTVNGIDLCLPCEKKPRHKRIKEKEKGKQKMKFAGIQKLTLLDYPEKLACTVFVNGCNFRCPFCHNGSLVRCDNESSIDESEILEFLNNRKGVLNGICISGGEPTLYPELIDFIRKVKEIGTYKIKLDTNGSKPDVIKSILDEGLIDYIAMDIKSSMESYPYVAGTIKIDFNDVIPKSIDLIINSGIDYEFRTTVVDGIHIEKDFYGIREMIKGAKRYNLQAYKDSEDILRHINNFKAPSMDIMLAYKTIVVYGGTIENIWIKGMQNSMTQEVNLQIVDSEKNTLAA